MSKILIDEDVLLRFCNTALAEIHNLKEKEFEEEAYLLANSFVRIPTWYGYKSVWISDIEKAKDYLRKEVSKYDFINKYNFIFNYKYSGHVDRIKTLKDAVNLSSLTKDYNNTVMLSVEDAKMLYKYNNKEGF
jgi:hypothetical protein